MSQKSALYVPFSRDTLNVPQYTPISEDIVSKCGIGTGTDVIGYDPYDSPFEKFEASEKKENKIWLNDRICKSSHKGITLM
jgi:hypothetical protein